MTSSEVYFWTMLPRVGMQFGVLSSLLGLGCVCAILPILAGKLEKLHRPFVICIVLAALFGWFYTLLPNEKQVKQILSGKLND